MTKVQPKILSGFMELLPEQQIKFNQIKQVIADTYESFGFTPLDTPVLELSEVLLAKAGGETEKQIYQFTKGDTDLSMRFDLTVPLARYVAMHQNDLSFPFKRYQIGKVYRGERPQKGRFREFYQCDIDIIGNETLDISYDAEMPAVIYNIFKKIGISDFTIRFNNRKILKGFFAELNLTDKIVDILRIVDKIAKIGQENVAKSLSDLGISDDAISQIISFITIEGTNDQIINSLKELPVSDETFKTGVSELETVLKGVADLGVPAENYSVDLSIARGLDYYTGTIYETTINAYPEMGSVCSGGRYDDLATFYTDKKLPGVGISIGLTRLFDQFSDRNLISFASKNPADILIIPMDAAQKKTAFEISALLRQANLKCDVFMEDKKFKAKMNYANKTAVPFIGILGEDEVNNNSIVIKNMTTGEQVTVGIKNAPETLLKLKSENTSEAKLIQMK